VAPARVTDAVHDDADDAALWLHPGDPAQSLIIGTNKVAAPHGALVVFGLDGRTRQVVAGLDRPNNVDLETGVVIDGRTLDLAVTTERLQHRLRVYAVSAAGLTEVAAIPVLAGETGDRSEPMGIALYKRPSDGALFAIVAPKLGGSTDYLWQYRVTGDGRGGLRGTLVRRFGAFSGQGPEPGSPGEIEAVVVDDALGDVYYADERFGIHKWRADPDHPDASREVTVFGQQGYERDREGLAIYATGPRTGYLVSTDQIPGRTVYKLYPREGAPGSPDSHPLLREVVTTADDTDGIEVTSTPLPGFPRGIVVAMNSSPKNFAIFDWNALFPAR
jgi:3-phytase